MKALRFNPKHNGGRQVFTAGIRKQFAGLGVAHWAAFTVVFAAVGAVLLFGAHAATGGGYLASAQSGTLGTPAALVSDTAAFNNQAVRFGTASSGGGDTSTGCSVSSTVAPCANGSGSGAGTSGWGTPVFDDEFTGTSLNTNNWTNKTDGGEQYENNVSFSASNLSVSGGSLIMTLSSSTVGSGVNSDPGQIGGKGFQFGDGYMAEVRMYLPANSSGQIYNWGGFWTSGESWPADGEIDVIETQQGIATSNYHWGSSSSQQSLGNNVSGSYGNDWHTYTVDRESGTNYIYYDGKQVAHYTTHDNGALEYLLLNTGASNGPICNCGGPSVYGTASQIKVDYARVWKKQ